MLHSVPPTLQQATTNPHLSPRLLDTNGQVNHYQPCNLVIPCLDIYPREKRVCVNTIKYTWNIIAVLFVIVKTQKQLMSVIMSMDIWYIHIMKYYPAIKQIKSATRSMPIPKKKNGLWSHSKTKSTYIVIPFKYVIRNANWLRESRSMPTYGPGSWDGWEEGISQKVAWGSFAVTWIYHVFSLRWLSHPTHVNLI